MLTHIIRVIVLLLCYQLVVAQASQSTEIVGRWRSDTAPTGYWIIDRYANGRYAKKQYLDFYMSKPAELTLEWGRWRVRGQSYSEVIDGTTSPTLRRFMHKPIGWKILERSQQRFSFESHDGQPRVELREHDSRPLLRVRTPPPNDAQKTVTDTITHFSDKIPSWVNSVPSRSASNQTLERTADRRENLFAMTSTLKAEAQLAVVSGRSAFSR
jgi:hypothetical protein